MAIESSDVAKSLSERYRVLHQAFTDLAVDAARFHGALPVEDAATRKLFTGLSRILAFSDHVHVALNLMGEDVRALESDLGDEVESEWTEQMQDCFEEWFVSAPVASSKVH